MAQSQRMLNMDAVRNIISKRSPVTESHVGKSVVLTIQGDGTVLDVTDKAGNYVQSITEPGVVLRKRIFNVRSNSELALRLPVNLDKLRAGLAAEKAGEAQAAHDAYTDYLNSVQISFNLLLPSKIADQLSSGVEIKGKIQKITTENGSLLTVDSSTISVMAPEVLEATTAFDIDALLGIPTPATPAEEVSLEATPTASEEVPAEA